MNPLPSADPDRTNVRESSVDPSATVDASADPTRPKLPPPPEGAPTIPGYAITGEIAKGGMGRVYAAVHLPLDREVAIKTLLPGANAERFVTESKITAKLPHPNIPPVHELGTLADGTPFLAMKYVRGATLAEQLKARTSPAHDLPRFIQIFEGICQAVGFAHSRGVIHRDLKPLNVMVGEFGEVQVMDWGLAKLQGERRVASPPVQDPTGGLTSRRSPEPDHTHAGSILGTPGYMAPEQARGESVDARADVFALGAVLAAILTGKPAFVGTTVNETITKAASAALSDVLARLDACGADAELIALAKRCLSADRDDRPVDGRAVASEVAAYRAGVEARLRQAETDRAAAVVREGEQRKRRRVIYWSVGVAGGILLVGTLIIAYMAVRAMGAERYTRVVMSEATENDTIRLFDDLNAGRVNTAPGGTVKQEAEDHLQRIDGRLRYLSGWDEGEHPVFGLAQSNLGWVLAEQGRYAEAHPLLLAGYEREMRRYRGLDPLARQHRELLRLNLTAARVEWAYRLAADSKAEEVHKRLAGELPVLLPQVDFNRPPGWVLQWRHLARAQAQHRSGATDDALDTLAGIATTTEDPPELAYALSAAYTTIGADGPRDREPTAQAAVRHIRRAGESGFRDVTMLKTDSAFDRLRGRADFRLVVMEIEKKAQPRADK